ncbi:MAG: DUF5817 domain-containing protein [Candidatus Bathyarchaeia archaeon]
MRKGVKREFREFCIVGCLRCGLLQIVRTDRKTRKCPRCGYVNRLDFSRMRVWYKTDKVAEAIYALQRLKMLKKAGGLR